MDEEKIVRCLGQERKASADQANTGEVTPLDVAARARHVDIVRCLIIEGKAKVN
jgi:ankyrin repeat protein